MVYAAANCRTVRLQVIQVAWRWKDSNQRRPDIEVELNVPPPAIGSSKSGAYSSVIPTTVGVGDFPLRVDQEIGGVVAYAESQRGAVT